MTGQKKVGSIGEKLVCEFLGGTLSDDEYDGERDLIDSDGYDVEVKTQVRFRSEKCFTIPFEPYRNNYRKCFNVDRLIFVEYELNSNCIRLWECRNRRDVKTLSTQRGSVIGFNIDSMALLTEIYDDEISKQLQENTQAL